MLRQPLVCQTKSIKPQTDASDERLLLLDIVNENHYAYHMETRDRPNNAIRLLVELHRLGATQEQLSLAYQKSLLQAERIRFSDYHRLNERNWEEFLGISSYYGDYVMFFDQQLSLLGLEKTLTNYFYSIPPSMGAQLQPLVQLAFGIEHDLPQIITQALAYYATSYLDVSNILDYCDTHTGVDTPYDTLNTILFDLIRVDQRFDGKFEYNAFRPAIKLLLKSKSDLIKTYMKTWSIYTPESRLDALVFSATSLYKASSRASNGHVDLDWFLAGGQLLEATLAIKQLIRPDHLEDWLNLQCLNTLCTYVVQGRPFNHQHHLLMPDIESCRMAILESSDPQLMLALASLLKVMVHYPQWDSICLENASLLTLFSKDGTWIKQGLGWTR
ncbi:hypothetical protein A0J61_08163 [Choanephora cucurbitarum]|uniref:Uncharacterized protein n=1 Tax=Choanephora cucurbitarum TaxID=101091 RepID=A0A1C7N443_9FUNG|nr:hypothetical protein A0J61_08163 [Choanephora cucurbitarum]